MHFSYFDNAVKDHRKRLQMYLLANGGHFEHLMFIFMFMNIHLTYTNCFISLSIIWCGLFLMKNSWISY